MGDEAGRPACRAQAGSPAAAAGESPLEWFSHMIPNCLAYAEAAKAEGRPIVGITCEYTPRELIMAAGGVPVCLCGGHHATVAAAEEDLPANLCPLIKSTYGFHAKRANPFLEMADLLVVETTCDGKKKMYELMAQTRPMHVLELPQKPDDPDAREHWGRELAKLKAGLEARFGIEVTEERLRSAIAVMNRERRLRRELAELMRADAPPLTGRELLDLKSIISCLPGDLEQYQRALKVLPARAPGASAAGRVRVLMTGAPTVHGAEKVVDVVEGSGGLVVCMENCTGVKPILDDVAQDGDPMEAIASKYFGLHCSVMTPNRRRFEALRRLAAEYRPQCIVELIWQACLTYDVESHLVRRLAEEMDLPYLRIETDYSPSDTARIATRVEALFETVRGRAARGWAHDLRGH